MRINGRCHCGNFAIGLEWLGDPRSAPARERVCSICAKHRGVWTVVSPRARECRRGIAGGRVVEAGV